MKRETTTRERILVAAANLFAVKGYSGTRTHEIAQAVGIRQPSLFHHFSSKAEIAEVLLEHSLGRVTEPVRALAASSESAAGRIYGYVYFDTLFLATSPYDLAGLHSGDVLGEPRFAVWAGRLAELHHALAEIVRQGIAAKELIAIDADFAQRAISGLNLITISMHHAESRAWATRFADDVATFALRGLLAASSELPRVRREGAQIAQRLLAADGAPR